MGPENATVQFKSKVPFSGRYIILVKFFQPNHSSFDIKVKIDADKLSYDGKLKCRNCPSNSGCREIVIQNGGFKSFEAEENVTVTFMVIFYFIFLYCQDISGWMKLLHTNKNDHSFSIRFRHSLIYLHFQVEKELNDWLQGASVDSGSHFKFHTKFNKISFAFSPWRFFFCLQVTTLKPDFIRMVWYTSTYIYFPFSEYTSKRSLAGLRTHCCRKSI